jgi:alkylation response protein AidB-like acyl-CoA dehydrogenase
MNFELSEQQAELQRSVRQVLAEQCPIALVREVVENGASCEQPWKSAIALGWSGINVPESCGGLGLGFEELGLVVEEHGRVLAPGSFVATTTWFTPLLREAGSAAQQERFLSAVVAGECAGTVAVEGAPASVSARRRSDGWLLDGARGPVLDGDRADEVIVVAEVEPGDGIGLFIVPRESLRSEPLASLDASRPLSHLRFDGVTVPADRVLGRPGACEELLERALDEARVALALEIVGACSTLLDACVSHAKHRIQFDQPIGAFQAVQHKCADMFVQVEKARATCYFAMMTLAEDDPRRRLAASMAKAAAGDAQRLVAKEAIQIHGGIGFTWECDVQLYVRRLKTAEVLLGNTAHHRARIANLLLSGN